jgi:hypothetical protein
MELFKDAYKQNSFNLNSKADAGEALNYILDSIHKKMANENCHCSCPVHQVSHAQIEQFKTCQQCRQASMTKFDKDNFMQYTNVRELLDFADSEDKHN